MSESWVKDLDDIKALLESPPTTENCSCSGCDKKIKEAGIHECDCGYVGLLAAAECACYDENAWYCTTTSPGRGCFHGALTCPWCDGGEVGGFDVLAAIRDAVFGKPATDGAKKLNWKWPQPPGGQEITFEATP